MTFIFGWVHTRFSVFRVVNNKLLKLLKGKPAAGCLLIFGLLMASCSSMPERRSMATMPQPLPVDAQLMANRWAASLAEPALEPLLLEALRASYSLAATAERVRAARAAAVIAGAASLPSADIRVDASRARRNSAAFESTSSNFGAAFELSWEVDIWGRLNAQTNAAKRDFLASEADYVAARLSLVANISRAWFDVRESQRLQELASQNEQNFSDNLEILEQNFAEGTATALDVRLTRSSKASAMEQRLQREQELQQRLRALELLLGRYPSASLDTAKGLLPELLPSLPGSFNVQRTEQRPDLLAVRQRLAALEFRRAAADRNLLPALRISADGGTAGEEIRDVFDLDRLVWSIAGNLLAPVFKGGRLKAEREQADANLQAAAADYAQAALTAFEEVETALTASRLLNERETALGVALEESSQAEDLAFEQYGFGLTDILTVLDAQRRVLNARQGIIQIRAQRLRNRVSLQLALGGVVDAAAASLLPNTANSESSTTTE